jgi:hypothetical protein
VNPNTKNAGYWPKQKLSFHSNANVAAATMGNRKKSVETKIEVYLRIRPLSAAEQKKGHRSCMTVDDNEVVAVRAPEGSISHLNGHSLELFKFSRVFDQATSQGMMYANAMKPLIDGIFDGQSAVMFAYGVSNSGNTTCLEFAPNRSCLIALSFQLLTQGNHTQSKAKI